MKKLLKSKIVLPDIEADDFPYKFYKCWWSDICSLYCLCHSQACELTRWLKAKILLSITVFKGVPSFFCVQVFRGCPPLFTKAFPQWKKVS